MSQNADLKKDKVVFPKIKYPQVIWWYEDCGNGWVQLVDRTLHQALYVAPDIDKPEEL